MMNFKQYFYLLFIFFSLPIVAQIGMPNHYPSLKPHHILDEKKEDIGFAFGMRILESDYNGPLIKLRRGSDNAELDFYAKDNDIIDINEIITYASGSLLYVVTWYDQSGLGRNAIQPDPNKQPVFTPDLNFPHFNGDFTEDFLVVETSIQSLTNNGKNGTVIGVFYATDVNNHSFGVRDGSVASNRWLAHINWSDDNLYFDPGSSSSGNRSIDNTGNINIWKQYSLIRRDNIPSTAIDEIVFRINAIRINTIASSQSYSDINQITGDFYFGIGATIRNTISSATPHNTFSHSSTKFCEFIMYAAGKEDVFVQEIEQNQITFWGL